MLSPRRTRRAAPLAAAVALAGLVAACGGVPGGTGSPAGVVRTALERMDAKQVDQIPELACAAQRDEVAEGFDLTGGMAGLAGVLPGLDADAFLEAVDFDISKVVVTEQSVDGDRAEVGVAGTIGIAFDEAKMRDVLRPVLEAQGMPTDDATIDAMLGSLNAMAQNVPIDERVTVVREDGAWKICDETLVG